ncbi:MAG: glycosyl hydrolase family 28 protein [Planctomycetia bacterium]|nr:glycosyl hydrolase family 28 protein [Planctomycetia bacterium]
MKIKTICLLILCFSVLGIASAAENPTTFNVRSYGAKGDGKIKDTAAIQKAIDVCTANGGGTVLVPAGTYLIGSIFLKNNVDFHLAQGAMLLGSPDKEDYNKVDVCPQNRENKYESSFGAHLILCIEQKNVSLRGPGRIDGNSLKFIVDKKGVPYPAQDKIPWRPSQMLYFVESENIRVQDIELTNSTYWTSLYLGCSHVFIRGVKIKNSRNPHTHNGDGIDIDCCEYVSVSDCHIDSADDCITLRGDVDKLKTPRQCRFITITNCVLSTPCNCFRFGVGNGQVNNITISNIVIETARTAFNFVSSWRKGSRGTDICDVRINNVCIDCQILVHMYYKFAEETEIRDISFSGITGNLRQVADMDPARRDESCIWLNAKNANMAEMIGNEGHPLQHIQFSDIDLKVFPGAQWNASNVKDLSFDNIILRSVDPNKPAQYLLKNVEDLYSSSRMVPAIPRK